MCIHRVVVCVFFFKQKTAYEMRISDWSSDVCSSDLYRPARITEQSRNPAIAVATILARQGHDVVGESFLVICPARDLALRRPMLAKHPAYPPLGYRQFATHMIDAAPPARRAQKFPRAASCRINLSSVRSEIARLSRRFSFSRSFMRRAWSVFRPPYSLRQR